MTAKKKHGRTVVEVCDSVLVKTASGEIEVAHKGRGTRLAPGMRVVEDENGLVVPEGEEVAE